MFDNNDDDEDDAGEEQAPFAGEVKGADGFMPCPRTEHWLVDKAISGLNTATCDTPLSNHRTQFLYCVSVYMT